MVVHGPFPVDVRVAREARVAVEAGFEVDIVAMREPGQDSEEMVEGSRVIRLPLQHRRGLGAFATVSEYLSFTALASWQVARLDVRRRYDIVQIHNPPDFLIAAGLVPKLLGARLVFDVHDLSPDMFAMRFANRVGAENSERLLRFIERLATKVADTVITVHEPYRAELVRRGVAPSKLVVVMNSVDESLLPGPAERSPNTFRVIYHGTVTPHYGVDLLVEAGALAVQRVPQLRIEVYGAGDATQGLKAQASDLGIADRVYVSGEVLGQREVLERIRGASAGVITNRPIGLNRFALSTKLFEYVVLGIPVVSANLPTIKQHFSSKEVLYFSAGDAESLAEALVEVARSPEAADARAEAARLRYVDYRWIVHAERYLAVLQSDRFNKRRLKRSET